jgi:hypothetical protein
MRRVIESGAEDAWEKVEAIALEYPEFSGRPKRVINHTNA